MNDEITREELEENEVILQDIPSGFHDDPAKCQFCIFANKYTDRNLKCPKHNVIQLSKESD